MRAVFHAIAVCADLFPDPSAFPLRVCVFQELPVVWSEENANAVKLGGVILRVRLLVGWQTVSKDNAYGPASRDKARAMVGMCCFVCKTRLR